MAEEIKEENQQASEEATEKIEGLEEIDDQELPQADELEEIKDEATKSSDNEDEDDDQQVIEEPTESDESQNTEENEEDTQEYGVQKKLGMLQKILIGVISFLLLTVIVGLVLYFIGFFDPEEPKPEQKEQAPQEQTQVQQPVQEEKKYIFKPEDINENRINRKLALLTKYEMIEDPEAEKEKQRELELKQQDLMLPTQTKEEEKQEEETATQEKNKEVATIEENTSNQPTETTQEQTEQEQVVEETPTEEQPTVILEVTQEEVDESKNNEPLITTSKIEGEKFLKFIQVATLKYKLYNSFLNQIKDIDARISVCKYKENQTQIFIGPFENDTNRDLLIKKINENIVNDAFRIEFTQEEFNRRCNF